MENATKRLENVLSLERIQRLEALARALRVRAEAAELGASGFKSALSADEITFEASEAAVYGVRAAKNGLSYLLNEASEGKVVFVESGHGGTVTIIGTETLADVIAAIDEISGLTLATAINSLPFRPAPKAWRPPQGHSPTTGISGPLHKV
jgi:hypothetical protein